MTIPFYRSRQSVRADSDSQYTTMIEAIAGVMDGRRRRSPADPPGRADARAAAADGPAAKSHVRRAAAEAEAAHAARPCHLAATGE